METFFSEEESQVKLDGQRVHHRPELFCLELTRHN